MKIYICISLCVIGVALISCKENNNVAPLVEKKEEKKNIEKSEAGSPEMAKIEYVKQFEPYLDLSVAEGWNVEKWKRQFGEPSRHAKLGDGSVVLEYIDMGEHASKATELKTDKLITGVCVYLKDEKTYQWRWDVRTFGMPTWMKEQMQKNKK